MKSTITKSLAAMAIVLAVGITPVFAKGNSNAKNNSNNQQQSQQNQLNQKSAKYDMKFNRGQTNNSANSETTGK